jgi:hypothetical protein
MKKTLGTLKSIVDGLAMYGAWYLWTAFMLWLGNHLIGLYPLSYWQSLGVIIVGRQLYSFLKKPTNAHVKNKV